MYAEEEQRNGQTKGTGEFSLSSSDSGFSGFPRDISMIFPSTDGLQNTFEELAQM